MRREGPKSCGKDGRVARTILWDLLQEREVELWRAQAAISHIGRCDYCRLSIERAIRGAREEGHETDYLNSFSETLFAAERKLETRGIKGERQVI